ncbi:MAG TPA: DUF1707 domain-containing protein [Streptosporangiaceae bacterium]|jgi:hypothetical protein
MFDRHLRDLASRPPSPRDLRASDDDRERVVALLTEAAADGRLTAQEHGERLERAYAARTLGELAGLTGDLAAPSAQPIVLDGRRPVAALLRRERRSGRWVVPQTVPVTAVFGEAVLDLTEAILQSRRVTVLATVLAGHVEVIVPEGVAVLLTGNTFLTRKSVRGGPLPPPVPGGPVVELRVFAVCGTIRVVTPRRSRWRGPLRRGRASR